MEKIDKLLIEIKNTFINFLEIENFINDLGKISNSIQFSVNGKIKRTSSFSKAFSDGNKLNNIPKELVEYTPYLRSAQNIAWLKWQSIGEEYLNIDNSCSYCTTKIKEEEKKKIVKVKETYETKELEHLTNLLKLFKSLEEYFSLETNQIIKSITGNYEKRTYYILSCHTLRHQPGAGRMDATPMYRLCHRTQYRNPADSQ